MRRKSINLDLLPWGKHQIDGTNLGQDSKNKTLLNMHYTVVCTMQHSIGTFVPFLHWANIISYRMCGMDLFLDDPNGKRVIFVRIGVLGFLHNVLPICSAVMLIGISFFFIRKWNWLLMPPPINMRKLHLWLLSYCVSSVPLYGVTPNCKPDRVAAMVARRSHKEDKK